MTEPYANRDYNVYGIWGNITKYSNDIIFDKGEYKMPNTKLEFVMSGDSISNVRKAVTFDLYSKDEDVLNMTSDDGWIEIDIRRIKNYRSLVMFTQEANIPFDVKITIVAERIIVSGMDTTADNGIYFESGLVNGRKKFVIDNGSYIQWNSTLTRWEKYSPSAVLEAYSDNVLTPDLGVWTKVNLDPYAIKVIMFNAEPMTIQCRDFFSFFPYGDDFMATVSSIMVRTSSGSSAKLFISSLGTS
jgi:hypothetical protein